MVFFFKVSFQDSSGGGGKADTSTDLILHPPQSRALHSPPAASYADILASLNRCKREALPPPPGQPHTNRSGRLLEFS